MTAIKYQLHGIKHVLIFTILLELWSPIKKDKHPFSSINNLYPTLLSDLVIILVIVELMIMIKILYND